MALVEIENQTITDRYTLYNGDCCEILPNIPDESVGFSIFSPPFSSLYSYSDDDRDMGNSKDHKEFFQHFSFLIQHLKRVLMPGRVIAVHCMDLPTFKNSGEEIGLYDFSGDVIRAFKKQGLVFHSRHCIWKDPLIAAVRSHSIQLAHKQIVKDSSMVATGVPDYLLAFRKHGENLKPIEHPEGLTDYYGARDIPRNLATNEDQRKNKRSHWIWQKYASPVWDDIRQTRVLPFSDAKDEDDQKHICPLQLDTIERCMELWSAKDDVVLSPFSGVGSEVFVAVKNGRRAIGIELKRSYYRQAIRNLESLK
jgi:DNA modification methylase